MRFDRVGGLPRIVFASDVAYNKWRNSIKTVEFESLVVSLPKLKLDDIPSSWKYLVAPFIRKGIDNPMQGNNCEVVVCALS